MLLISLHSVNSQDKHFVFCPSVSATFFLRQISLREPLESILLILVRGPLWSTLSKSIMRFSLLFFILLAGGPIATVTADDTCPINPNCGNNYGSCKDCGGISDRTQPLGLCTTVTYSGCPCLTTCGDRMGPCDQNGCDGFNSPTKSVGICMNGDYKGCVCTSNCGQTIGSCKDNGCSGVNSRGGLGYCTAGKYKGCSCESVCGTQVGSCGQNGCNGMDGICTAGVYMGCSCT